MRVVAGNPEHSRDLRDVEFLSQLELDQVLLTGVEAASAGSRSRERQYVYSGAAYLS